MDLLEIIDRIDHLNKQHSKKNSGKICHCDLCKEIRALGKQYEKIMKRRRNQRDSHSNPIKQEIRRIVAKGINAKPSEIRYLVEEMNYSKKDVARMLRINYSHFAEKCKQWGIGTIYKRRGKREEVS